MGVGVIVVGTDGGVIRGGGARGAGIIGGIEGGGGGIAGAIG